MRINHHRDFPPIELEFDTLKLEVPCCLHKLHKTWDEKRALVGEVDFKLLRTRGDPMKKCIQVGASMTVKREMVKVGKCDRSPNWRMHELPLFITVGTEIKIDLERLQLGHE
jgi:hypothetical protein